MSVEASVGVGIINRQWHMTGACCVRAALRHCYCALYGNCVERRDLLRLTAACHRSLPATLLDPVAHSVSK